MPSFICRSKCLGTNRPEFLHNDTERKRIIVPNIFSVRSVCACVDVTHDFSTISRGWTPRMAKSYDKPTNNATNSYTAIKQIWSNAQRLPQNVFQMIFGTIFFASANFFVGLLVVKCLFDIPRRLAHKKSLKPNKNNEIFVIQCNEWV